MDSIVILDWNHRNHTFILKVNRNEYDIKTLMVEHGLDLSTSASTRDVSVLYTAQPYAAVAFAQYATPNAAQQLRDLCARVEASWAPAGGGHYPVPPDKELWPFQVADLDYGVTCENWLDGDEPGLGKTPTAIVFCNEVRAQSVLVICPASIRLQWQERVFEWSTMRQPYTAHTIMHGRRGVNEDAEWIIVSYELASMPGIYNSLMKGRYDVLILDEAHYLKTPNARRTRTIFGGRTAAGLVTGLSTRAERVVALTGTPLPNRPREAYTLARALDFGSIDFLNEHAFGERFNPIDRIKIETKDEEGNERIKYITKEGQGRRFELQARLRSNFMTRHLKREVMTQLKMPVYDLIRIQPGNNDQAMKNALQAERLLDIDVTKLSDDITIMGAIAQVRHDMGVALAPTVAMWCRQLIDNGEEKLVLFGWHHDVLDIWEREFEHLGVLRVDGRTSATRKKAIIEEYVANPRCHIIIGNLLSLGTGTDGLQRVSNHALIGEADWAPGNNIQAFDRLDRGGQTRTVQGDIFVVEGSISEKILVDALTKLRSIHTSLDKRV